ncbi:hypothetical protein GCM10010191_12950 [Actinomadura vinacea]|uniref:Halobacterial output domain-containing protein n=1 Tax=Actinomadura vinacea TaxID=115336 RepID=A0ABP5VLK7_9ACTN
MSVREDAITSHLGAVLIRAIADKAQVETAIPLENVEIPRGEAEQVVLCRRLGLELTYDHHGQLTYDHHGQSIATEGHRGPIVLSLR